MVSCPRCGNDAEYLADEPFSLIRCEFCGDDIDADLFSDELDRTIEQLLIAPVR
ncbi:MAG TPA: hypothetical protein VJ735_12130 [Actinomycetes bacterium]|nr:hypothetical protein [Actinomycetes bacterium]